LTVLTTFRLEEDLRKRFRFYCVENDTTLAETIRELITIELDEGNLAAKNARPTEWLRPDTRVPSWNESSRAPSWEESY
jgi:hypothetical protein